MNHSALARRALVVGSLTLFGTAALAAAQVETIEGVRMRAHLPQSYDASGYSQFADPFDQLPGDIGEVSRLEAGRILGEFDNDLIVLNEDRLVIYYRADQFNHPMLIDDGVSDFTLVHEPGSARDRLYVILTDGSIYEYFEGGGGGSGGGSGAPAGGGGAGGGGAGGAGGGGAGGGGGGAEGDPGDGDKGDGEKDDGSSGNPSDDPLGGQDPEPKPDGTPVSVYFKSKLVLAPVKGLKYFAPEYGPIAIAYGSEDGCLWAVDSSQSNLTYPLCPATFSGFAGSGGGPDPLEVARLDWDNDGNVEFALRFDDEFTIFELISQTLVPVWTHNTNGPGSYTDDQIYAVLGSGGDRDLLAWTYDASGSDWLATYHSQLQGETHQPLGREAVADLASGDVRGESAPGVPDGKDDLLISFEGGAEVRVYQRGQSATYSLAEDLVTPGQSLYPFSDLTGTPQGIVLGVGDLDRDGDEEPFFGRSFADPGRETLVTVQTDERVDSNTYVPQIVVTPIFLGPEIYMAFSIDPAFQPGQLAGELQGKTGLKLVVDLWTHADRFSGFADPSAEETGAVDLDPWISGSASGTIYALVKVPGEQVTPDLVLSYKIRVVQEVAGAWVEAYPAVTGHDSLAPDAVSAWTTVLEQLGDWLGPGGHILNVPVLSGSSTQGSRAKGSAGPPPLK
ncbi:MAG: hypothetical protein ACYS26_01065 [Planctomycetota bacterium]|jgi:hypothetical protein